MTSQLKALGAAVALATLSAGSAFAGGATVVVAPGTPPQGATVVTGFAPLGTGGLFALGPGVVPRIVAIVGGGANGTTGGAPAVSGTVAGVLAPHIDN